MHLSKIGEFGLIEVIKKLAKVDSSVIKGIGDDAAILRFSKDRYLILTSDMLIEDVHFKRTARPFDIGHKALACSISDIASMGGIPKHAIVSVGLPLSLSVGFVRNLYKGIISTAKKFKINIVGGDTNRSSKIIIDVAILGEVKKKDLVLRSKAKSRDEIFVTGKLGGSAKTKKHLKFKPRLKESRFLIRSYRINSMIDISDGLSQDLGHILKESKKGAIVYEQAIPKDKGASLKDALYNGEDYELLFTLSKRQANKLVQDIHRKKIKFPVSKIGIITKSRNKIIFIDTNKNKRLLKPKGFRHF